MSDNNKGLEISVHYPKAGTAKTFKFDRHALYGFPQQRELREDISEQAASITKPNTKSPHAEAVAEAAKRAFVAQVEADAAGANQKKSPDKVRSELLAIRKKLERDQNIMQVMSRTPVPQTKLETGFELIEDVFAGLRYGVGVAYKEGQSLKKRELREQEREKADELKKSKNSNKSDLDNSAQARDLNQKLQQTASKNASKEAAAAEAAPAKAEPGKGPLASIENAIVDAANGAKAVGAEAAKGAVEVAADAKNGLEKVATEAAEGMGDAASNAPQRVYEQVFEAVSQTTPPAEEKPAEPAPNEAKVVGADAATNAIKVAAEAKNGAFAPQASKGVEGAASNAPTTATEKASEISQQAEPAADKPSIATPEKGLPPRNPSEGRPYVIRRGEHATPAEAATQPAEQPKAEPAKRQKLSPGMEDLLNRARMQGRASDSPTLELLKPKDQGGRPTALSMRMIQARKQAQAALPTKVTVVTNLLKINKDRGR